MKRIVEIIVKDVLLTGAKDKYPYAEEVAQFLASLTSELSRCVSSIGSLSLFWIVTLVTAPHSQNAANSSKRQWYERKPQIKDIKLEVDRKVWKRKKKAHCCIQLSMLCLDILVFFFLEILRKQRAHWKEPGRNEKQNETGTFSPKHFKRAVSNPSHLLGSRLT